LIATAATAAVIAARCFGRELIGLARDFCVRRRLNHGFEPEACRFGHRLHYAMPARDDYYYKHHGVRQSGYCQSGINQPATFFILGVNRKDTAKESGRVAAGFLDRARDFFREPPQKPSLFDKGEGQIASAAIGLDKLGCGR
jgi:hypothetical protein